MDGEPGKSSTTAGTRGTQGAGERTAAGCAKASPAGAGAWTRSRGSRCARRTRPSRSGMSVHSFERHVQPFIKTITVKSMVLVPPGELERWVRENSRFLAGELT